MSRRTFGSAGFWTPSSTAGQKVHACSSRAEPLFSKGFGLIQRFSEDVDVTVFRDDLGQAYSFEQLEAMSRKKRDRALDDIKAACEQYINGELQDR
ncbi:MAG TPA: nucleotidyl transferase AbiEii/AbiGii toxin family protein [Sphingomicrobium sp.]|nr:nucleotidyl transferase AbiEii/AbiGii toxin family protein [Sphingomicrobium sp.]